MKIILSASVAILMMSGAALAQEAKSGKDLYDANCARCHGKMAQGDIGVKLAGDAAYWTPALFNRAVLAGKDDEGRKLKKKMPRFNKKELDDGKMATVADLAAIQAYLQTLGPKK